MALVRFGRLAACALALATAAGCGGGGGSSTPSSPATPVPTPTPTATPAPCTSSAGVSAAGVRRASAQPPATWVVPDRLYVSYRNSATARTAASVSRGLAVDKTLDLGADGAVAHAALTFAQGTDLARAAATLRQNPDVVDVQPVHYRRASALAGTANDSRFNTTEQWYLFRTAVATYLTNPGGWTLTHGDGIDVAVIDTGADETNLDLAQKFTVRERVVGGIVTNGAGTVQDTNGHGTNVAGLVAAATNNTYGYASTGWNVNLQIYKVFPDATACSDSQNANTADEARAIRDAVAHGASVINLSLGGAQSGGSDPAEQSAVAYAISQGVTVVAAGGNEYPTTDGQQPDFPAAYPGVIAVGASAVQNAVAKQYTSITADTVASYSNSGVALLAPGGDAPSSEGGTGGTPIDPLHWIEGYSTSSAAYPPDKCSNSGGVCAAYFNGTSQATPQVSGAVALMMAYHSGPKSLTPAQSLQFLQSSATPINGVSQTRQGYGLLNVYAAVAAAHP